jgi:hypothetical protein
MRLHLLAPDVNCPACGAGLTFIRVRGYGDLYRCASGGPCRGQVMHYQRKESKICGYAAITHLGSFGDWTACDMAAAKG